MPTISELYEYAKLATGVYVTLDGQPVDGETIARRSGNQGRLPRRLANQTFDRNSQEANGRDIWFIPSSSAYLARAVLKRPRILIFDEATSGLDQQTAERFAQTGNRLKGVATLLFIAHQLPKGLSVDEVYSFGADRATQMRVVEGEERE